MPLDQTEQVEFAYEVDTECLAAFMDSFLRKGCITVGRIAQSLAVFLASGVLVGACALPSAADENKVTEQAAQAKSDQEIKRLTDQLGSERFKDREQATRELSKLGKFALPSLKQATNSPDAEVRRRAQQLVDQIDRPPVDLHPERLIPSAKSYL